MNRVNNAFLDELTKIAVPLGPLRPLWAVAKKRPGTAIGLSILPIATGTAAYQAYKSGRSGQKGRYLEAEPGRPSKAALINYNKFIGKKPINKRISESYKEDAF